eukprot:g11603.t1
MQPTPIESDSLSVIADGLLALTADERQELDRIITPRAAALLAKAFGQDFYRLLLPLTENDGPDGQPAGAAEAGRHPDEESLREMMRDPRYWRDKDPAVLEQVSSGFRQLYG